MQAIEPTNLDRRSWNLVRPRSQGKGQANDAESALPHNCEVLFVYLDKFSLTRNHRLGTGKHASCTGNTSTAGCTTLSCHSETGRTDFEEWIACRGNRGP